MTMPLPQSDPLAQPVAIGQASAVPADALNARVTTLQQAHPWLPADSTVALAQSDRPTSELVTIADGIKQTLNQTWNGFSEVLNDNVLHKQPSTALAFSRFLHASLGPLPVRQDDLHVIQANLQKAGFGHGLSINGVWNSDWNAAYNQWSQNAYTRQLAGDRPGAVSTAHAGHSIFSDLLPSHAINAIVGFAHGLAHGVNTLLGDVAGAVVDVPHLLTGHTDNSAASNATRAWFQNIGGGDLTGEDVARQNEVRRVTQDVGTMLALVPVAGEGSAVTKVVQGAWEGGVSREMATRTGGVIARTLGGRTADEAAAGLNTRVFQNIPLLRQVGPVVGRLADDTGVYYKTRTLLASPYALPQIRAAGALGQHIMVRGAGLGLAADIAPHVGFDNQITHDIRANHVVDTIDLNLGRIAGLPNAHLFSRAVDSLGFVLHGPLGSTAASTAIGDHVQNMTEGLTDVLGHVGVEGSWQLAVAKATGRRYVPLSDLHDAFGSEDMFHRFMANKLADLAAAHHAQNTAQKAGLTFGSPEYRQAVGQYADEVWNNAADHEKAIRQLLGDPIELSNRVAADMVHNRLRPTDYHPDLIDSGGIGDVANYGRNGVAWMNAGNIMSRDVISSGLARHWFGPDGQAVIARAQDAFDHGLGMDSPVRLSTATRREYVNQVSTVQARLKRQVDQARVMLGKHVADSEAAYQANPTGATAQAVTSARRVQQMLEDGVDQSNLRGIADLMKQTSNVAATRRSWERMVKDVAQLRALVDQGTGERLTLRHLLDNGVNPDELYTNINGEPRMPDQRIGSGEWMAANLQHKNGTLGFARLDTKTAQQATADIGRLRTKLDAAGRDQQAAEKVAEEARNYGFREFGFTENMLGALSPRTLLDRLDEHAGNLASDVFTTSDAPPELAAAVERMRTLGYKPVLGSHIGHLWDHTLPSMPDLRGAITRLRRVAGTLGLTPEQVSSRAAGQDTSIRLLREWHQATLDPRFRMPPRHTAESLMTVARDRKLLPAEMRTPERVALNLSLPMHRKGILQLAKDRGLDYPAAKMEYEQNMARALQLRDIPRSEWLKAFTTPGEFDNGAAWTGLDRQSANLLRRATLRAYSDRPGYIQGASVLEDWLRGGFSLGGHLRPAVRFSGADPMSELVQRVAELPNSLINLRNRWRFTLSPFFDFRRVAKQNAKMFIDKVKPVANPLAHMIDNGTFNKAHRFLDKIIGDPQYAGFDDADRYLHQQSVWGMYNSRHFEAYYAWEKKQAGWSDEQIRQGIRRVFDYGSQRVAGRSALERTVNTVFFPFSFEKTLLRNVGAYMIDHPQQALLMTGAITAYDDANKNSRINNWVAEHLPVLRDMQKLNAFAHGISPGEFGGINAPLMNLFMPQQWNGGMTKKNLQRFLPVWKDFGQLLGDVNEQRLIGQNALLNARDYALSRGAARPVFDPYRPTITRQAQQYTGGGLRNQFIIALAPVLQHNASTTTGQIVWPKFPGLPYNLIGKPIDRTTIGLLVKQWYPAYDPTAAAKYVIDQKAALADQIAKLTTTNPARAAEYQAFQKLADTVASHLTNGTYATPEAAALMMSFRQITANLSETDPALYKIYKTHFQHVFGPLEEVPK